MMLPSVVVAVLQTLTLGAAALAEPIEKDNNIILTREMLKEIGGDPAHSAALLDTNPACPAAAKYKVIVFGKGGLYALLRVLGDVRDEVQRGRRPE